MSTALEPAPRPQGVTLHGVSWPYYEQTLREVGDQHLRLTYLDGSLEIMSPLPEHEAAKTAICGLIDMLTFVAHRPRKSFGSATFRREDKSAGTEPDACYYFTNIDRVKGMKRFDPAVHPAPDLVIEVDLLSPSIPREPVYARLGVPEIWRYDVGGLTIRSLSRDKTYTQAGASQFFPFVPIDPFTAFIRRMIEEEETTVLAEFGQWLKTLDMR
ncbi:MAG TPA: Uma2 family endonuclease [Tepidisphaeraceae bacterium]|jgi:Uma2 family endonuclease|nr:Uma2 family endonuclease [Tepidisphaeraceae bacterium]